MNNYFKCLYLLISFISFTLLELIDSEREYIDRLGYCITNYKATIDTSNSTAPKVLKTSCNELFGNIQDIYNFHKKYVYIIIICCEHGFVLL